MIAKGFRMSLILVKNRKLKNFIKTEKTYCAYQKIKN